MKVLYYIILFCCSLSANAQQWVWDEIAEESNNSESIPTWLIVALIVIGYFVYKHLQHKEEEEQDRHFRERKREERQQLEEELQAYKEKNEDKDDDFIDKDILYPEINNFNEVAAEINEKVLDTSINTPIIENSIEPQIDQAEISVITDDMEAVDLGLSVKWSNFNLGASKTNLIGKFFIWGEIIEHDCSVPSIRLEKVGSCAWKQRDNYFYALDGKDKSELEQFLNGQTSICGIPDYDVASKSLGAGWRLPSKKEAEELQHRCKWSLTTINGIKGTKVTGPNGNSIFIPFAGYIATDPKNPVGICSCGCYWLGDPAIDKKGYAAAFALQEDASPYFPVSNPIVYLRRCNAHSIRPVFDEFSWYANHG